MNRYGNTIVSNKRTNIGEGFTATAGLSLNGDALNYEMNKGARYKVDKARFDKAYAKDTAMYNEAVANGYTGPQRKWVPPTNPGKVDVSKIVGGGIGVEYNKAGLGVGVHSDIENGQLVRTTLDGTYGKLYGNVTHKAGQKHNAYSVEYGDNIVVSKYNDTTKLAAKYGITKNLSVQGTQTRDSRGVNTTGQLRYEW